jgi:hypothetical protein
MVRRAVPPAKPTSTTVPISIDELAGEALFGEEASELLGGLDGTDGRQLLSISKQIGVNLMERPARVRT